jgi:hypothetical protein
MCSENGNVVLAKQQDAPGAARPQYLQCRDKQARCSLAASAVDEQVASGGVDGSLTVWDTDTGLAKHYVQDEVRSSRAWIGVIGTSANTGLCMAHDVLPDLTLLSVVPCGQVHMDAVKLAT